MDRSRKPAMRKRKNAHADNRLRMLMRNRKTATMIALLPTDAA
jgi:hypothetical protein